MKLLFAATQFAGEGNLAAWRCANVPKGYKAAVEVRGGVVEAGVRGLDADYEVKVVAYYDAKADATLFDAEVAGQRTLICRREGRFTE